MGVEASKPQAGATLKVIGAGLPRTGTASFAAALTILLNGPVYHSGTQMLVSDDESHIKTQIEILKHTPIKAPSDKAFVLAKLKELTEGYVATCDSSLSQFVPELCELYPDALVICTIRDPEKWARSMGELANTSYQWQLALLLFWVPCLRYFPRWVQALHAGRWGELYEPLPPGLTPEQQHGLIVKTWEKHVQHLKDSVPKDRLVFYDVKEGWQPLCEMLDVKVPEGKEFPWINDGAAMDAFAKKQVQKGLFRWAVVVGAGVVSIGVAWKLWRSS